MKRMFLACAMIMMVLVTMSPIKTSAILESRTQSIIKNCDKIKENLRIVQHSDSRTRVYLGRYYETILSKYITPLNVRLVENNLFDNGLMNTQDNFAKARGVFISDFIEYQKGLEELVATNCKENPEGFYEKLVKVREERKIVADDTTKLKSLADTQLKLVTKLKEKL